MMSKQIVAALAVTAETTGAKFSEETLLTLALDLNPYPTQTVVEALALCRRELHYPLKLADVMQRIARVNTRRQALLSVPQPEPKQELLTQEEQECMKKYSGFKLSEIIAKIGRPMPKGDY